MIFYEFFSLDDNNFLILKNLHTRKKIYINIVYNSLSILQICHNLLTINIAGYWCCFQILRILAFICSFKCDYYFHY